MRCLSVVALWTAFGLGSTAFAQDFSRLLQGPPKSAGKGIGLISSSSNSMGGPFTGLSIADVVGASRFYAEGYTGSRAIASSIEGGHVWSGHETLNHVNTFLHSNHPSMTGTSLGQTDRHATWVGQIISGRGNQMYQQGIAPSSSLWSGSIATQYSGSPYTTSWGWSNGFAFTSPYQSSLMSGVNGQLADVVNSSWGFNTPNNYNVFAVSLDAMVRSNGKTLVFAAGNNGPGANSVLTPGNGHNAIVVGATGPDTTGYQTITNFSSRGPSDYVGPDGSFSAVRARVDIVAPGQSMTAAFYGGVTGGNLGGFDPSGGAIDWYSFGVQGTSFAAPTVTGGVALLADVGKDRFGGGESIDTRVMKSVLLNSASKNVGWNNSQTNLSGVVTTTQALDFTYGAGLLNLDAGFDQYTAGTTNLPGLTGGSVSNIGWDFAEVTEGQFTDFFISPTLEGGTNLTATLNWLANSSYFGNNPDGGIATAADSFTNLGLEVWATTGALPTTKVAESRAMFITTQHLSFDLPTTGSYMLRVRWLGERYDFVGNASEKFGLAWNGTASSVPEPASLIALIGGIGILARRRRKSA